MKTFSTMIAAATMLATPALAAPHRQITEDERADCLTMDNDDDGTEFCAKSLVGMTQAQIDAWITEEARRRHRWMDDVLACQKLTDTALFRQCGADAEAKFRQY
jgi:hypothetical protein